MSACRPRGPACLANHACPTGLFRIAQYQRKAAKNLGDPASQQMIEQQAKMMDTYATWIKHIDLRIELTDAGIELKEAVDSQP